MDTLYRAMVLRGPGGGGVGGGGKGYKGYEGYEVAQDESQGIGPIGLIGHIDFMLPQTKTRGRTTVELGIPAGLLRWPNHLWKGQKIHELLYVVVVENFLFFQLPHHQHHFLVFATHHDNQITFE